MNRAAFLADYRARLLKKFPWAQDAEKLDKFMASVEETIAGEGTVWDWAGETARESWKAIGGKGKPTLTALRGLVAP